MSDLATIAPAFVAMAHRIVWCSVATVDAAGNPRTRVLHPIWEWRDGTLTGWIATSPLSPKAADLAHRPAVSITYWDATQDTCTADCSTTWDTTPEALQEGWDRFANGAAPVGYDPRMIPGWTGPDAPSFGILRLAPNRLRVMPGSMLMTGQGDVLTWHR